MSSTVGWRRAWRSSWQLGAAIVLLAGCAALDAAEGKSDSATHSDAGASEPLRISVLGSALPKVNEKIELRAIVTEGGYAVRRYSWKVTGPENQAIRGEQDSDGDQCSFTPALGGSYGIACTATLEADAGELAATSTIQVEDGAAKLAYTARVIPSPASGLPPSDFTVEVGTVAQRGLSWQLQSGREVTLDVREVGGTGGPLPTMVRLLQVGGDPLPRDIYLSGGTGSLRVVGAFRALFLPQSSEFAAWLDGEQTAGGMSTSWSVAFDRGVLVEGAIRSADSAPLTGSTVTLQTSGEGGVRVPSTVGVADALGAFALRARPGVAQLTVAPPPDSGLPVAVVEQSPELGEQAQQWSFQFAELPLVKLSGRVVTSAGNVGARGAQLVLTVNPISSVGVLKTATVEQAAEGRYRRVLATDADGAIIDPTSAAREVTVPAGSYAIDVWPGAGEAQPEGHARLTQELRSSPLQLDVGLAKRVKVSGTVQDQTGAAVPARVRAIASAGSFSTEAETSDGRFTLYLDQEAEYQLVVQNRRDAASSAYVRQLSTGKTEQTLAIELPPAVVLAGKVTTDGNLSVSAALVRIWCSDARCPTHEIIDEARIQADGNFVLRVPPTRQAP